MSSSLRHRAIRGSLWTMLGYGGSQLLRLGSTLILTRMLFPEVYGKMVIAGIFFQGLQMFSDVGVGPSIIQHQRGDDPDFYNTAWTLQILRGGAIFICAMLLSWPMSLAYGQPDLKILLPVIAVTALIGGFNSTSLYTLNRNVQLAKQTVLDLSTQLASIATTIVWAYFNRTVWALVAASVMGSVFRLVASHFLIPGYHNRLCWNKECTHALFKFGRWIFLSTALTFFAGEADKIIFSVKIPLAMMGLYQIADTMAGLPTQAMIRIVGPVTFSVYCRMGERSADSMGTIFGQLRMPLLVIAGWAISGMIVVGPSLIHTLYDTRYANAGWILQILVITAWFEILETTNGSALMALAKPSWVAAGNAAKLIGVAAFVPIGFAIGDRLGSGFRGALIGMTLSEIMRYGTTALAINRQGFNVAIRDLGMTLLAAVTVAVALLLESRLARVYPTGLLPAVVSATFVCAVWGPLAYRVYRAIFPARSDLPAVDDVALATVEAV